MKEESKTQTALVLEMARQRGVLSRRDLLQEGLPPEYLAKLANMAHLEQLAPGVYMDIEADVSEHLELVVVSKRVPDAVFFGLTALQFHQLTTQVPHTVELAIRRNAWAPKLDWPTISTFRLSETSFSAGIETHNIEINVSFQVYSVAKTVADLFKFRSRYGVNVAIEALREGWREQRFTLQELEECAKSCRVHNVMRPYMEMLS